MEELEQLGVPHLVVTDHQVEGHTPVAEYRPQRNRTVYAFGHTRGTSLRAARVRTEPFRYRPVDPSELGPETAVRLVLADAARMNFLKDRYLAPGIEHVSGELNVLVYLGEALAGGFIYRRDRRGSVSNVYLLSDFAVTREGRISKLVAMLASARAAFRVFETKSLIRAETVTTTAFTDLPISMKYRGIYELVSRKPGMLNYGSRVREGPPQAIYAEWWRRWGRKATGFDACEA